MIKNPGFIDLICSTIISMLVSGKILILESLTPSLSALNLICDKDSSPVTYKTSTSFSATSSDNWRSNVDLPIPGSPPNNINDPLTIPFQELYLLLSFQLEESLP